MWFHRLNPSARNESKYFSTQPPPENQEEGVEYSDLIWTTPQMRKRRFSTGIYSAGIE